jgi:hypothetical protein
MLDFNSRGQTALHVNAAIDAALVARHAATPPRTYLGGSRLGHACERALQFEFLQAPKDEGADFDGRILRIFGIGHALEDVAVAWLRAAGFDLYTRKGNRPDGEQFGFAVAGGRIRGHVDGILAGGPAIPGLAFPALWECKTMNAKAWRETSAKGVAAAKPIYAAQIAVYQAYMDAAVPGVADNPALFTSITSWCRSTRTWRSACRTVPSVSCAPATPAACCRALPAAPTSSSAASARGRSAAGRCRHEPLGRLQRRAEPSVGGRSRNGCDQPRSHRHLPRGGVRLL